MGKLTRLAVVGQLDPFVRLSVLFCLHYKTKQDILAFNSTQQAIP